MSGSFSITGLGSGLDWGSIVEQLMLLEQQPVTRLHEKIAGLEAQKNAITGLRTQLSTLRGLAQDFGFSSVFNQFESATSDAEVLSAEVTGSNPVIGSYDLEVLQLASATVASSSAVLGGAIDPNATLDSSGINTAVTEGDFTINGVAFTIDPTTDTLNGILANITASAAGVNATYDAVNDAVVIANKTAGDTSVINFGATDDDSNFLTAINVTGATQTDNGSGATEVTSTHNLGAVSPGATLSTVNFAGGAVTAGTFQVNGVTITVDPTTQSLTDVVGAINGSDAGVTASYDTSTDTIRVVSDTLGSRTVKFTSGTSNFLSITNLDTATQAAGSDSQFTVNGGPVETRNTNEVADAIGGVTVSLLSVGTSTVSVSSDDDAIVGDVQEFLDAFNASIVEISNLVTQGGALQSDGTIQTIKNYLQQVVFNDITGISGEFNNLLDIGISTGDSFDREAISQLSLDEEEFRDALREDRANVERLFSNTGDTGVADILDSYLNDITSFTGSLNARSKSSGTIDQQIQSYNDRIDRLGVQIARKEERLTKKFIAMDQLVSLYQQQNSALSQLGM
jgi:flagellar hook-associated protein 2